MFSFFPRKSRGWGRCIGCLKLQVVFRQRATHSRALLREMTYKDKASYGSSAPSRGEWNEMKRETNKMKRDETRWNEMEGHETTWNDMKRESEWTRKWVKRDETRDEQDETRWNDMRRHETRNEQESEWTRKWVKRDETRRVKRDETRDEQEITVFLSFETGHYCLFLGWDRNLSSISRLRQANANALILCLQKGKYSLTLAADTTILFSSRWSKKNATILSFQTGK